MIENTVRFVALIETISLSVIESQLDNMGFAYNGVVATSVEEMGS